jgi:hypothetical protein
VSANVTLAPGATLDPQTLVLAGQTLELAGSGTVSLPSVSLAGGTLDSTRDLRPDELSVTSGTLSGNGTTTMLPGSTFSKTTAGQLTVRQGADLIMNVDSALAGGSICLQDLGAGEPSVQLGARLTLEAGASADPFNCSNGADVPHLLVRPGGELVKTGPGLKRVRTPMKNDGEVRVVEGTLQSFGTAGASAEGEYLADAGATVEFNAPALVGPAGRVGGAGTARVSAAVTLAAGATLDPQALELASQTLKLEGVGSMSLGSVSMAGGTLDSTRELHPTDLSVTTGTLSGNGTTAVPAGGSFSKTTAGRLTVRDGADLMLDVDSTLAGGSICLQDLGGGDPSLQLNARLTIEATANEDAFDCSNGADIPHLLVNPGAELVKTGPGVKRVRTPMKNDGEVRVVEGTLQSFGTAGASAEGEYLADAGATVEFNAPALVGTAGRVGGAGTARVSGAVTLAAGATLNPRALELASQTLKLEGAGVVSIPTVSLLGGTLDSTRPLNPTALNAAAGTLTGNFTTTVPPGGSFSKTTAGQLTIRQGADLILNVDSALAGGSICLQDLGGGDPSLQLNARLTIEATAGEDVFNCSNGADVPHLLVNPGAKLVKSGPGLKRVRTPMKNDGEVRVVEGTLQSFGTAGASAGGEYLADAGATVEFNAPALVGPAGRVGGAGTARTSANLTMAAGATLDPQALELAGQTLKLEGSAALDIPSVSLLGGTLDSTRPLNPTALNAAAGTLTGDFTTTVPPTGSFSKTTAGQLTIRQGADLILNVDSALAGGSICLQDLGGGDPSLQLNARLTIEATANENAFNCSNGADVPHLFVNPTGELHMAAPGLKQVQTRTKNAGTVGVGAGHQLKFLGGYEQVDGLTRVASDGELIASVSLAGGVLAGSGKVTGNVLNSAGSVRPGASPGALTVQGAYTQGAGGTLQIEIEGAVAGTEFDRLLVTGTATLGGALGIVNDPGFAPTASDRFPVLSAARRSGTFSNVTGAHLPTSFYVVAYNPTDVTLARAPDPAGNTSSTNSPSPGVGASPTAGGCLSPAARVRARRLGPARLGRTRRAQRGVLRGSNMRSKGRLDRYCLVGGGSLRIGYAPRGRLKGRVVLVAGSGARFSLKGVKPGMSEADGKRRLGPARRVPIGGDIWHVARRGRVLRLMRTRRGLVKEIGIADARMTGSRAGTKRFLQSW